MEYLHNLIPRLKIEFIKLVVRDVITNPGDVNIYLVDNSKCNTAYWFYNNGQHNICISKELKPENIDYAIKVMYHESCHALWTEKDMKKFSKKLDELNIPFDLFNIFEDIRIEELWRIFTGDNFEWYKWVIEYLKFEGDESKPFGKWKISPEKSMNYLLAIKWAEQSFKLMSKESDISEVLFNKIMEYHKRAFNVNNSWDLIPVMQDWIEEFGLPPKSESSESTIEIDIGELSDEEIKELLENSVLVVQNGHGYSGDEKAINTSFDSDLEINDNQKQKSIDKYSKGVVIGDVARKFDIKKALSLIPIYNRLFEDKSTTILTIKPSKRMDVRADYIGLPGIYKTKSIHSAAEKSILVVLDCSGSMCGTKNDSPINNGKILLKVFSILAQNNYCKGHVVLTGVECSVSKYQTFKLPLTNATIENIFAGYGAEGINQALLGSEALAVNADHVFVITDGMIGDTPVDKKYWHIRNTFTYGLYVNPNTNLKRYNQSLSKHFDIVIVEKTIEELSNRLVRMIKN